jgi:hypothetical protein
VSEYQAFARLLRAVRRVELDVQCQPYGVEGEEHWDAQVDPVVMDELLEAYHAAMIAHEETTAPATPRGLPHGPHGNWAAGAP